MVDKYLILDSMTYTESPAGFIYHYRVLGELDNPKRLTDEALSGFKASLAKSLREDISLKTCKERGLRFTYRYISTSTGELFTEASFGPEDYE